MFIEQIDVGAIVIGERLRRLDAKRSEDLAISISLIGLNTPITVRIVREMVGADGVVTEDVPVLVAGLHRLEAVKGLGWETIPAIVTGSDDRDARLWEISENLHRAELSVQERAEHIAEWVRLVDEKNKPAQVGQVSAKGGRGLEGGVSAAVREIGVTRQEAQRAIKIATIAPEAKIAAQEAGIDDNQAALLRVAKEANPAAQLAAIRKEQDQAEAHKRNRDTDRVIALTESQLFGEWLMHQAASSEVPMVISWLECCKAKDVIAAMRREAA